ncbi:MULTISPECIES: hydroxymethylglutaryl-CoA lyase [unclassified Brevundimonas]|uniref:hydroxymethylglutaryl-CoA lyase n=1 Tax=unclassified Brevundimonas TaxID=2622653 RepID=UPI000CFCA4AD|nr:MULTISPECIES: hydroxymethylglutaryl-CoA lyase [unclassified Brevundimonas]PRA29133.1 hydroxymethylglutaryl-CoA lyase [Brevundimonas sp. MYb27]PQZ84819.1 hydroxymethylglutaryl-CoA lyase [Brevundimonas sp. MYb31]PRB14589.1 hydroxymethylglutaryl-CoA lyase [Brevundimonas sp. MYb52]PRB36638.1 hydroxymethylglutaryl-CoA lyase [Brevundimonas sp. MYb46]PRB55663.1 hydroxymethylglutaryl-CoA lyase [Brevundimonas sp. MYb33]
MTEWVEVSPRDGLQNEKTILSTADKVALIERAVAAGARRIEVASFVNPKLVPQMADAEAVIAALPKRPDVRTIGLVLNERGAGRALTTSVKELGIVVAASDVFGTTNQGLDVDAGIAMAGRVIEQARAVGRDAQVTISVAFGCPLSGAVDPARVVDMARRLAAFGPLEIALADTIGVARPGEVSSLVAAVVAAVRPLPVRVHFHDTRGTGVANAVAAVAAGAMTVDASIGGTGGCPFAPGASGNVATEDVAYALNGQMAVDIDAVCEAAVWLNEKLQRTRTSAMTRAWQSARERNQA